MRTPSMRAVLIRLLTLVALTVSSGAWAGIFVTAAAPDASAPVLTTTPSAQTITGSTAIISWASDKVADSRVYFGTALPLVKVAGEIEYATAHAVKLTKLLPNTSYSYQVVSVDPMGNKTTGAVQTFTTSTDTKTNQTIGTITFAPATLAVGGTTTASATATSGLGVTFSTTATPTICSVSGSTVTGLAAGTCTVAANQLGNSTYNAATQVTQNITVKVAQTIGAISFTPNTLAVGGTTTASASATSGLAIAYSNSATPTICSVSGTTVTGIAGGTCTITASQAGDATYSAATAVTQSITVSAAAAPAVSLNPTSLTFTNQAVGTTSAAQSVTLTNTGGAILNISRIDRYSSVYGLTHNCSSLPSAASCTLNVTYSPTSAVSTLSTITVTSDAPGSTPIVVLNGNGVPPAAPVCTLSASPTSVPKNGTSVLTSSCTNSPTSYSWTGGNCAGSTAAACTVNPAATTTYGVTGTNSGGSGAASATVTVRAIDLTPILMLLLD